MYDLDDRYYPGTCIFYREDEDEEIETTATRDSLKEERDRELLRQLERTRYHQKRIARKNRTYTFVSIFFGIIFISMIGYLIYFDGFKSDDFINSPYNTRQDSFSDRVVRGKILSSDGQILAQTNVSEDGTETA
ncbi:MAG: hypothetical protein ACLURP_15105 [Ruminococcus sp.]